MTKAKWRSCILTLAVFFSVSACGVSSSSTPGASSTNVSNAPLPFAAFLQQVEHAQYSDYAQRGSSRVQNEQAFQEMRSYILKKYVGVQVASSYNSNDGQIFDCIVRTSESSASPPPAQEPTSTRGLSNASMQTNCPDGTIPTKRITLAQLVQFPTLQAFLAKSPGGPSLPLPPTSPR